MANCPKCRTTPLSPIDSGAAGADAPQRCPGCHGIWIPRHAILFSDLEAGAPAADPVAKSNDAKAGMCPSGHGLLRRARLEGEVGFALDRCPACGGTWFDAGEWHELASRHLLGSLDVLWDPLQQRRSREEQALNRWHEEMERRLGPRLLGDLEKLGDLLAGHPDAAQALAYLGDRVRRGRR
ncbi:MAG TPA: zf-TFIIB domain-containing protein [Myxococcales bacterium]|jgi:Zn-finger nucleic acid-binding protein